MDEHEFDGWEDLDFERFHSVEDDEPLFLEDEPYVEYQPVDMVQAPETLQFLVQKMERYYDLRSRNIEANDIPDLIEELMEHASGGTPEQYEDLKDFVVAELGYTVTEAELPPDVHGRANSRECYIVVDSNLNLSNKIRVLSHEIGHVILHGRSHGDAKPKQIEEIEAESVAMIMADHLGIEAPHCSELYIAFWMKRTFMFDSPEHLFSTLQEDVGSACNWIKLGIDKDQEQHNDFNQ